MEEDDKANKGEEEDRELLEEERELLEKDGDTIQVDHKLKAQDIIQGSRQEFDVDSKFFSRFAVCTLLVGCYWFYPEILVRNPLLVGK